MPYKNKQDLYLAQKRYRVRQKVSIEQLKKENEEARKVAFLLEIITTQSQRLLTEQEQLLTIDVEKRDSAWSKKWDKIMSQMELLQVIFEEQKQTEKMKALKDE